MARLLSILFWSVLAAAFIGPGTVTVATKAGHAFGPALLWALTFSTIACIVLQEASARITAVSGKDLATALRERFAGSIWRGPVLFVVVGAVVVGCAAYQTGNVLGAIAGARLELDVGARPLTVAITVAAAGLLWAGSTKAIATVLGGLVALMGGAFLWTAALVLDAPGDVLRGAVVPTAPAGAGVLILGLVGTTVVPYNLFLGSGLARGWTRDQVRFGIVGAVGLGGLVSMAVLVVGAAVEGEWSYAAVAAALEERLGDRAPALFAFGLFAAGLSSALTAPLAAAITAHGLFGEASPERPREKAPLFRATWILVLASGAVFGLRGAAPAPAIVFAQALNGVLLPLVAVFLLGLMNDRRLLGDDGRNGPVGNALLGLVVAVTFVLGGRSLWSVIVG